MNARELTATAKLLAGALLVLRDDPRLALGASYYLDRTGEIDKDLIDALALLTRAIKLRHRVARLLNE